MYLARRRSSSRRPMKPITLTLQNYNTGGQGGFPDVIFLDEERKVYYTIVLESEEEYRELASAVAKAGAHV